eukprot:3833189-Alexandrium_andersonii.AAC.1
MPSYARPEGHVLECARHPGLGPGPVAAGRARSLVPGAAWFRGWAAPVQHGPSWQEGVARSR